MNASPQVTIKDGTKEVLWSNAAASELTAWSIQMAIQMEFPDVSPEKISVYSDAAVLALIGPAPAASQETSTHSP